VNLDKYMNILVIEVLTY